MNQLVCSLIHAAGAMSKVDSHCARVLLTKAAVVFSFLGQVPWVLLRGKARRVILKFSIPAKPFKGILSQLRC